MKNTTATDLVRLLRNLRLQVQVVQNGEEIALGKVGEDAQRGYVFWCNGVRFDSFDIWKVEMTDAFAIITLYN